MCTCHFFLGWCLALRGEGKDWLAEYQDNVTEWNISLCQCQADSSALQSRHECAVSQTSIPLAMALNVTKFQQSRNLFCMLMFQIIATDMVREAPALLFGIPKSGLLHSTMFSWIQCRWHLIQYPTQPHYHAI